MHQTTPGTAARSDRTAARAASRPMPWGGGERRPRWQRALLAAMGLLPAGLLLAACTTSPAGGGTSGPTSQQPDPYPAAAQGPGPNGSFYDVPAVPAGAVPG